MTNEDFNNLEIGTIIYYRDGLEPKSENVIFKRIEKNLIAIYNESIGCRIIHISDVFLSEDALLHSKQFKEYHNDSHKLI